MSPCLYLWEAQLSFSSHECAEVNDHKLHESTVAFRVQCVLTAARLLQLKLGKGQAFKALTLTLLPLCITCRIFQFFKEELFGGQWLLICSVSYHQGRKHLGAQAILSAMHSYDPLDFTALSSIHARNQFITLAVFRWPSRNLHFLHLFRIIARSCWYYKSFCTLSHFKHCLEQHDIHDESQCRNIICTHSARSPIVNIVQRLTPRLPAYVVETDQPRSRSSAALVLSP